MNKNKYNNISCLALKRCGLKTRALKMEQPTFINMYFQYSVSYCCYTYLMRGNIEALLSTTQTFLLTHLMRGATGNIVLVTTSFLISTHTPHARCDRKITLLFSDFTSLI